MKKNDLSDLEKPVKRRGRPPKQQQGFNATRADLLRVGLEVATEKGFSSVGLDEILKRAQVPKGSFYHYFDSKERFGLELIEEYAGYYRHRLAKYFDNSDLLPLERLRAFARDAEASMAAHDFRKGCLAGNLAQEVATLPDSYRGRLVEVFQEWQGSIRRCLDQAQLLGQIDSGLDCGRLADFFWIGWEGAVLRAKLEQSSEPMTTFADTYLALLCQNESL